MLDFYVTRDPKAQDEGTWQHIGGIDYAAWESVFFDALGCERYVNGEDKGGLGGDSQIKIPAGHGGLPIVGQG